VLGVFVRVGCILVGSVATPSTPLAALGPWLAGGAAVTGLAGDTRPFDMSVTEFPGKIHTTGLSREKVQITNCRHQRVQCAGSTFWPAASLRGSRTPHTHPELCTPPHNQGHQPTSLTYQPTNLPATQPTTQPLVLRVY
jgi:hypothetical protein